MSASPRRSQARIAYPSDFATQSAFGTALSNGAIDAVFSLDDSEPQFEIITKDDEIKDCTGQYLVDEVVQARSCRLSFGVVVEGATLFGLLGWGMGVVAGDEVTLLGPTEFQPAPTTLIYGHNDSAGTALKLKDMVLNSIRVTGRVADRITAQLEFRGYGNPAAATSWTWPECSQLTPIYIKDGAFSVNSVDRLSITREFEFAFSNNLLADDDPFTLASPDITRMERADEREYSLTWKPLGQPGDAIHAAALAKSKWPFSIRIGSASDGVTIATTDTAILKQGGPPTHDGQARRSVLNLLLRPIKATDETSPLLVTRNTA